MNIYADTSFFIGVHVGLADRHRRALRILDANQEQLKQRQKGDAENVRMALRLRAETTMTLGWIAQRLGMGARTHLSHLLYWQGRPKPERRMNNTKTKN